MVIKFPAEVLYRGGRAAKVFGEISCEEYLPMVRVSVFTDFGRDMDPVEEVAGWREAQFFAGKLSSLHIYVHARIVLTCSNNVTAS